MKKKMSQIKISIIRYFISLSWYSLKIQSFYPYKTTKKSSIVTCKAISFYLNHSNFKTTVITMTIMSFNVITSNLYYSVIFTA